MPELESDEQLSSFAFKLNLRRYNTAGLDSLYFDRANRLCLIIAAFVAVINLGVVLVSSTFCFGYILQLSTFFLCYMLQLCTFFLRYCTCYSCARLFFTTYYSCVAA